MIALIAAASASAEPHQNWPNRGRLGMEVQSMTDALREFFGAPADRGVLVVRVPPERPAAQAGVQVGDVLISAGGEALDAPIALIAAVARVPAGGTLALELVRKGKTETIDVSPDGEPVEFSPPEHGDHGKHAHGEEAHSDFHDEVLRRLQSIEQKIDGNGKK
jgi:S1-C subfamily serine protease